MHPGSTGQTVVESMVSRRDTTNLLGPGRKVETGDGAQARRMRMRMLIHSL